MSATEHHHSSHHHHHRGSGNTLLWVLALTIGFAVVEAVGGVISGSLALLGDAAGHMVSGATAPGLAALTALINGTFMLLIVGTIAYHAIERLWQPQPVAR